MTRDEILNMPAGKKLDQYIWWKVFGMEPTPANNDMKLLPNYSTEISAAWEVVEKFDRREWDIEIGSDTEDEGRFWSVSLTKWGYRPIGPTACGWRAEVSLPLAICQAALLAVGVTE